MSRISERANILICVGFAFLILLPVSRAEGAGENALKLLKLAEEQFGTLNKAEEKLFRSVDDGGIAYYRDPSGKNNDPNGAKEWDPNTRVIRAKCIAWLCTDPQASAIVTHKGILVKGARIDGELDLSYSRISFPLNFEKSAFSGSIKLLQAEIMYLYLSGTHTGPIYGDGLKVEGSVFLRDGFKAEGEVRLVGAIIGGDLDCSGGKLINKGATALYANFANIGCSVFLSDGFKAEGEVKLIDATIGIHIICGGGEFVNKGAIALNASGANIKGSVFLNGDFKAEGEVNLVIATIGGVIDCEKGQFNNSAGYALSADSMKVKGHVFIRGGFKAEGVVELSATTIDGYFIWRDVNSPEGVTLNLRSASVGTLWDDKDSWPEKDELFLHGLVYKEIFDKPPKTVEDRIEWLHRQPSFSPQPYEQLAEVLRKGGQDEDARKILIAKNEEKAGLKTLTRSEKFWYRVFGPMIDYGYRPLNALWGVLMFVVSGWVLFGAGYWGGVITPQSESAYVKSSVKTVDCGTKGRELSDVYPRFNFLIYSIDTFVPLVDLHQGKYWLPNANHGHELLRVKGFSLHTGGLLRLYLWIHIVMGWALSTLLVVGLTGLVRT